VSRIERFSLVAAFVASAWIASPAAAAAKHWVGSWASAQLQMAAQDALPAAASADVTLRQLVRTSIGGSQARVRFSNAFGNTPLTITGVTIARAISPASSRIDASTEHAVTFGGARSVTIPAGAEYVSDPISMSVPALATFAVSIHLRSLPNAQTGHPGSRATSYFVAGDQLSAPELRNARTADHWYFVSGLDVDPERPAAAIAIVGDSITDGHGVVSNTDTRWTDTLAERLKSRSLGVLNLGIGANCLAESCVGPNVPARFNRDVLSRSGVKYLLVLEGVNDLGMLTRDAPVGVDGHRALVQRMIGALAQITAWARERGIKVIGATIMPYGGSGYYHPDAANEADRAAVNAWIRSRGNVDAVVDFDALMCDPLHPNRLKKEYDSGDGLHPSPEGYRAMGAAVPLALFSGR
jgi:lysophospholipase L1-like esterase